MNYNLFFWNISNLYYHFILYFKLLYNKFWKIVIKWNCLILFEDNLFLYIFIFVWLKLLFIFFYFRWNFKQLRNKLSLKKIKYEMLNI